MTRRNDSQRAARDYMRLNPGTTYRQALAIVQNRATTPVAATVTAPTPALTGFAAEFDNAELNALIATLGELANEGVLGDFTDILSSRQIEVAEKALIVWRADLDGENGCPECGAEFPNHTADCYHVDCDEDDYEVHGCGRVPASDKCDECEAAIPANEPNMVNAAHAEFCSLHPANTVTPNAANQTRCDGCERPVTWDATNRWYVDEDGFATCTVVDDAENQTSTDLHVVSTTHDEDEGMDANHCFQCGRDFGYEFDDLCRECEAAETATSQDEPMTCARCQSTVHYNGDVTDDGQKMLADEAGYFTCGDYTGHDRYGTFAPNHTLDRDERLAEDNEFMVHHDDSWNECSVCVAKEIKEVEGK